MKGERDGKDWSAAFQFRRVPLPREVCGHTTVLRPYLDVLLEHKRAAFETLALVDTGADFSMVPREVAEVLGIDVDRIPGEELPFSGVGAGGVGKQIGLDFTILSDLGSLRVSGLPFVVMLDSPPGQSKDTILGRHPLFRDFDLGFRMGYTDDPEIGKFTIRRVTKRRDAERYKRHPRVLVPSER